MSEHEDRRIVPTQDEVMGEPGGDPPVVDPTMGPPGGDPPAELRDHPPAREANERRSR